MRLVFMGTPGFALPSLRGLIDAGHEIAAVVTQPDRPAGRGQKITAPPIKDFALQQGLPVSQPNTIKDPAWRTWLEELRPDLATVVAYGRILPRSVLDIPRRGCVNLHASLLPKYRGAAPAQWAIIRGERETGVTTIVMDEGMDTGPVLLHRKAPIDPAETAEELLGRLSHLGAGLLVETVRGIENGDLKPVPQDSSGASKAPILRKEDGRIRWEQDAVSIYNLIRGTHPWPGAHTFHPTGVRWQILRARVVHGNPPGHPPGQIIGADPESIQVSCGQGVLALLEIQPENRRSMTVAEYRSGHAVETGGMFRSAARSTA